MMDCFHNSGSLLGEFAACQAETACLHAMFTLEIEIFGYK